MELTHSSGRGENNYTKKKMFLSVNIFPVYSFLVGHDSVWGDLIALRSEPPIAGHQKHVVWLLLRGSVDGCARYKNLARFTSLGSFTQTAVYRSKLDRV